MQKVKKASKQGIVAGLLAVLALPLAAVLGATLAQATTPGQNGKIAFTRDFDEIYTMNADGSGQTNISNNAATDDEPHWSSDGKKIVFTSNRDGNYEIYTMDGDGSNPTRLTNHSSGDFTPSWSPDGSKIAFISNRDGNSELYIMNADGSGQTRLTNTPAGSEGYTGWSPDGNKIVFDTWTGGSNYTMYTINPDGTGLTALTVPGANGSGGSYSPDGSKIAFATSRDGNWEIYSMDPDGSNQTRITNNGIYDAEPFWSPDGTKIGFERNGQIYSMDPDGTNAVNLSNNIATYDYSMGWQPLIAPVATNDPAVVTAFGVPVVIDVLSNDSDTYDGLNPASVVVTVAAGNGTTSVNSTNGAITYTPNAGFSGSDSFTYRVCSSESATLCDTAVVTVTVTAAVVAAASLPGLPGTGIESNQSISKGLVAGAIGLSSVLAGKFILQIKRFGN